MNWTNGAPAKWPNPTSGRPNTTRSGPRSLSAGIHLIPPALHAARHLAARWGRRPRLDVDEIDLNEALELTGTDVWSLLFEQELTVPVVRVRGRWVHL